MTPEEINMKIAELCGWKWYRIPQKPIHGPRFYRCLFLPAVHEIDQSPEWLIKADMTESICNWPFMQKEGGVFNYCGDLNAMHEAEESLKPKHEQYAFELAQILGLNEEGELSFWDMWKVSHATAPQRAEAFLRITGKWIE